MSQTATSNRPRLIEIDLAAIEHNFRLIASQIPHRVQLIPALKANAYGHGAGPVAACLAPLGVRWFATGSLEDALAIRAAAPDARILAFAGPAPEGVGELLHHGVTPTVHNHETAEAVSRAASQGTGVFVKVDAGLGRIGVPLDGALAFIQQLSGLNHLVVEGLYTHLPFSDAAGMVTARERVAGFDALITDLEAAGIEIPITQVLASAGTQFGLTSRANAISPGHLLFGLPPVNWDRAEPKAFRPALRSIRSVLIDVHAPADKAGTDRHPTRIGVIPMGLADGMRPIAPNCPAHALIAGHRTPILAVSLEYTTLDLSDLPAVTVETEVTLLGQSQSALITLDQMAAWQGSSGLQVIMGLNGRVPRRYLGTGPA